ncbi:unnamed protein product, partial [marine sediment metagenome]
EGQGNGTFIDGDGLANGEHAIQIIGDNGCTVKNLSIQTKDGGTNTIHCFYINDSTDYTTIKGVTIIESDDIGILIEGTSLLGLLITKVSILGTDGVGIAIDIDTSHTLIRATIDKVMMIGVGGAGIYFDSTDALTHRYVTVSNCIIYDPGSVGIRLKNMTDSIVKGNLIYAASNGIELNAEVDHTLISTNNIIESTADGLLLTATSDYNSIIGNHLCDNASDGIQLTATSDSNYFAANYLFTNGAYGINIANANCDANYIGINHFVGNVT